MPNYTPEESAACLDGIYDIRAWIDQQARAQPGKLPSRDTRLVRLHLISVEAYVGVLRVVVDLFPEVESASLTLQSLVQGRVYGGVEVARYEIYRSLRALDFPQAKVFMWMHDWHAFRHASETGQIAGTAAIPRTTKSLGQQIADDGGDDVRVIGNLVPCNETCKEPEGSLEPAFAAHFGNATGWLDFRHGPTGDLPVSAPGVVFANHHGFGFSHVILNRQLDGIVYVPRSAKIVQ